MLTCTMADGLMIVTASGRLSREDIASFATEFEKELQERRNVPMLIDARALEGYEPGALWEDIKFDVAHRGELGPMAVAGDERWKEWGTKLSKPFFKAELRHFGSDRMAQAEAWLRGQRASRS